MLTSLIIYFKQMSLCLNEGRDVIVALMMADLDTSFPTSGEFCCSTRIQLFFSSLSFANHTLCDIAPPNFQQVFSQPCFQLVVSTVFCRRSRQPVETVVDHGSGCGSTGQRGLDTARGHAGLRLSCHTGHLADQDSHHGAVG